MALFRNCLRCVSCVRFRGLDGEAMLVLYSVFRGEGQTLILIYHTNVFAPGVWHDGLFGRWSGGSLISDSLFADTKSGPVCDSGCMFFLGLGIFHVDEDVFSKSTEGFVNPNDLWLRCSDLLCVC